MTHLSNLKRLVGLRARREETARAKAAIAAAQLRAAQAAVTDADAAIDRHDEEASAREQRFVEAMGIRPVPGGEVARGQDRLAVAGHRREELMERRRAASAEVSARRAALEDHRADWRVRQRAHDKLAEADARLERLARARAEASSETEADEEGADQRGHDAPRER